MWSDDLFWILWCSLLSNRPCGGVRQSNSCRAFAALGAAWLPLCACGGPAKWTVKPCRHVSRPDVYFLDMMACFNGIYLKYCKRIQPEFRYDLKTGVFFIGTKFRGDVMRSCCVVRVKICKFRTKRQGVNQCFHLHARAPPTAVPGWVD